MRLVCFLLLPFFLLNCSSVNDASTDTDFLIFGTFYGECLGEQCVEIFKLTSDKLYEDRNDQYPASHNEASFYVGDFIELSSSLFEESNQLWLSFPNQLKTIKSGTVYGQPDSYDQGGIYIELKSGTIHKYWILDTNKEDIPAFLHSYMDEIQTVRDSLTF